MFIFSLTVWLSENIKCIYESLERFTFQESPLKDDCMYYVKHATMNHFLDKFMAFHWIKLSFSIKLIAVHILLISNYCCRTIETDSLIFLLFYLSISKWNEEVVRNFLSVLQPGRWREISLIYIWSTIISS